MKRYLFILGFALLGFNCLAQNEYLGKQFRILSSYALKDSVFTVEHIEIDGSEMTNSIVYYKVYDRNIKTLHYKGGVPLQGVVIWKTDLLESDRYIKPCQMLRQKDSILIETNKLITIRDSIKRAIADSLAIVKKAKEEYIERKEDSLTAVYKKKYPYGCAYILDYTQNSVGGLEPTITWHCLDPNIKIKYINFTIRCYNKVNDIIYCCFPSTNANYRFAVGESTTYTGTGECTYYCDNVYNVELLKCTVETYDGKTHTIPINKNIKTEIFIKARE